MIKKIGKIFIIILFFLTGVLLVIVINNWPYQKQDAEVLNADDIQSGYINKPPARALVGQLVSRDGIVEVLERGADDYIFARSEGVLLQGEVIRTQDKSSVRITLGENINITLDQNSSLELVNLISETILLYQTGGTISYELQGLEPLFSVRALNSLLSVEGGSMVRVSIDGSLIEIGLMSGNAKFSYIDEGNQTQVVVLNKESIIFNSFRRKIQQD